MKILITGSSGFIGKNLMAALAQRGDVETIPFDLPDSLGDLRAKAADADFVFHLAGVNRPIDPAQFETGNAGLTGALAQILKQAGRKAPLVLSSSIQAAEDNPYGLSKKAAEDAALRYAEDTGAPVYIYRFPNVFGKWCRPNYNSVVATFCHNAARNMPLRVDDPQKEISLLYIDDLVAEMMRALDGAPMRDAGVFCSAQPVSAISLGDLAGAIEGFARSRQDFTHGYDRADPFMQKLYATFTSFLPEDSFSVAADMKKDARGYFAELIRSAHFGQISVSRTKPGVTRGNHWHHTKVEKFIVIEGEAVISFRKIGGDEVIAYRVSGENVEIVDIPPGYTHAIENIGQGDVLTIFWAGELFDPDHPDTMFQEVSP